MQHNTEKFKETEIGLIPEEWDVLSIEKIADVIGGGTPSTKNVAYFGGSVPWITPRDLSNFQGRYIERGERNISEEGFESSNARMLPKGTVLLTSRAPVGYLAIAANEVTTNQGFQSLVPSSKVDNLFLYYLLRNNIRKLIDHSSGSTFQELSGKTLRSLTFAFPEIQDQQRIASVLSSLDDKIELNHQINANLEKMASTLFKRWFVDFEFPDGNGLPYKSNGGKMVESEMGEVPEGWRAGLLRDVLTLHYGKALKAEVRKEGSVRVYGSSGFVGFHNEKLVDGPGVVVGRKGNVGSVFWIESDFYPIDTTYYIESRLPLVYSYYLLMNQTFVNGDSVVPGLSRDQAYRADIVLPDEGLIHRFGKIALGLRDAISFIQGEIETLTKIRDSLLPRLMSGRIRAKYE